MPDLKKSWPKKPFHFKQKEKSAECFITIKSILNFLRGLSKKFAESVSKDKIKEKYTLKQFTKNGEDMVKIQKQFYFCDILYKHKNDNPAHANVIQEERHNQTTSAIM